MSSNTRKANRQPRLGRGLSSLMGQPVQVKPPAEAPTAAEPSEPAQPAAEAPEGPRPAIAAPLAPPQVHPATGEAAADPTQNQATPAGEARAAPDGRGEAEGDSGGGAHPEPAPEAPAMTPAAAGGANPHSVAGHTGAVVQTPAAAPATPPAPAAPGSLVQPQPQVPPGPADAEPATHAIADSAAASPQTSTTIPPPPADPDVPAADADAAPATDDAPDAAEAAAAHGLHFIGIDTIQPNRSQPRQNFDPATLESLAASIRSDGVMQPILVRPCPPEDGQATEAAAYELIAGERRWRAAKLAGLEQIPAIIREMDGRQAAEWALIENLQREDLNPIERAEAFRGLCEDHGLSHEEVAERLGMDRSTVANAIRLLELPETVLNMVREGSLSAGHARCLLGLPEPAAQARLARKAVEQAWSVRRTETAVRQLAAASAGADDPSASVPDVPTGGRSAESAHLEDISRQLGEQLGTRVTVTRGKRKGSGRVIIEFYSLDEFDALTERLGVHLE